MSDKRLPTVKFLTCCCCGSQCRGRQWHNRDTGWGICQRCATFQRKDLEEDFPVEKVETVMQELYGNRGFHYF